MINPGETELLAGAGTYDERVVGAMAADGTVYAGTRTYDRVAVGRVDSDGTVYSGSKTWDRTRIGTVNESGTIYSGNASYRQQALGMVASDGVVSRGDRLIGKVRPADRRAGAALLLLVEPAAQPGGRSGDVLAKGASTTGHGSRVGGLGAFVAGAAAGAAAERKHEEAIRAREQRARRRSADRPASEPADSPQPRPPSPVAFLMRSEALENLSVAPNNHPGGPLHREIDEILEALRHFKPDARTNEYGYERQYTEGVMLRDELLTTLWRFRQFELGVAAGQVQATQESFASFLVPTPPGEWFVVGWRSWSELPSPAKRLSYYPWGPSSS